MTAFALLTAIRPSPWYDPRYAIPLLGMILGNFIPGRDTRPVADIELMVGISALRSASRVTGHDRNCLGA